MSARPTVVVLLLLAAAAACGGSEGAPSAPVARDGGVAPVHPTAAGGDPRLARGAALNQKYCALCHGPEARGYVADNAPSLVSATFLASADDTFLSRSIELGRPGTAMAGYGKDLGGPLGERDLADLVYWLRAQGGPPRPLVPSVNGVAARGAALYGEHCQRCHGVPDTRGTAPHLANPTFLALASDPFLRYAIASGRPGTPMEPFADRLRPQQIDDVVAFVRSWAKPPATPPAAPGPVSPDQPVVINPKGKAPKFRLREQRFVAAAQVAEALAAKQRMIIVDARAPSDWARERIAGAISIPYYEPAGLSRVPPDDGTWVLAYCACPHHASGIIVDELQKRGYKHVAVIDEGILFWAKQGYPIQGDPAAATPPGGPAADPHAGHVH